MGRLLLMFGLGGGVGDDVVLEVGFSCIIDTVRHLSLVSVPKCQDERDEITTKASKDHRATLDGAASSIDRGSVMASPQSETPLVDSILVAHHRREHICLSSCLRQPPLWRAFRGSSPHRTWIRVTV
jgi:hypothetical protein